jgi:hypothetical protein
LIDCNIAADKEDISSYIDKEEEYGHAESCQGNTKIPDESGQREYYCRSIHHDSAV